MTAAQGAASDGPGIFEQAREAAERGEFDLAASLYARLSGNPDPNIHVAAMLGLADARYRLDDDEGALQAWLSATQAPETPDSWRAWVALAGVRVRQGDVPGAARAYREAERRAPPEEQPMIASRLGWLNKEMGNEGAAGRYFSRTRTAAFTPLMTYLILGVTVTISLFVMYGPAPVADQMGALLALNKQGVLDGEYWRLLTVTLVHGGLIHLMFNMYALYIVGPLVEALYGRVLFVAFYLLAAAGGSIASYLFFPSTSVGASGAIFGLFGLLFVATFWHKPLIGRQARAMTTQIGVLIAINLVIGFGIGGFARIDNAAHVGGLLAGAWLGLMVAPRGAATLRSLWQGLPQSAQLFRERNAGPIALAGIALLVVVLLIALSITPFWLT